MRPFGILGSLLTGAGLVWLLAGGSGPQKPATVAPPNAPPPVQAPATAPAPSMDRVKALRAAGFHDAAVAELQRLIQTSANPQLEASAAPPDLLPPLPTVASRIQAMLNASANWLIIAAEILAIPALLLLFYLRKHPPRKWRPYLVVSDFESGTVDASLGKTVAAALRQGLAPANRQASTSTLRMAVGPVEPLTIPADVVAGLSKDLPLVPLFGALMRWLSPRQVITVGGVLHPTGARGVGLTLTLAKAAEATCGVTLWEADFDPDFATADSSAPTNAPGTAVRPLSAHYALAVPAITWLHFVLHGERRTATPWRYEGTCNWRSYAYFLSGARLQRLGRNATAIKLYQEALRVDLMNRGARLNLTSLVSPPDERKEAIARLRSVVSQSHGAHTDGSFFTSRFNLASTLADDGRLNEAYAVARALVLSIVRVLREARRKAAASADDTTVPGGNRSVLEYLEFVLPSARVLMIALAPAGDVRAAATARLLLRDAWIPLADFQYNLACFFARHPGADHVEQCLSHLSFAASINQIAVSTAALQDKMFEAIRTDAATRERFARILSSRAAPAPQPKGLAALAAIGQAPADALSAAGVTGAADLVVHCASLSRARALADRLHVSVDAVVRWAHVAELLLLRDMQPGHVNAFTRAGRDSCDRLRGASAATITRILTEFREASTPPADAATVDAWTREIAATASVVIRR